MSVVAPLPLQLKGPSLYCLKTTDPQSMNELFAVIPPLLLVDVLNPVLFAVLIFAAGSSRPVANSSALLLGHTLAYFVVGIAASYAVDALVERLANPKPIDIGIELVVGLACLYSVLASREGGASEPRNPVGDLQPPRALLYGVIINFIGAPFALPYLAVVSQILDADISTAAAVLILVAYNVAYALPFAMVPLLVMVMGDRAKPMLRKINDTLVRGTDMLMPWLMLLLGLWLTADAVLFFVAGQAL